MIHVVKLLVERQRLTSYVKVGMFNNCFIRVSDYMLLFVMVFVNRFGRYSVGNVVIVSLQLYLKLLLTPERKSIQLR